MNLGLVELLFVFGSVLAIAFWELYSLHRDGKKDQSKDTAASPPPGDDHSRP